MDDTIARANQRHEEVRKQMAAAFETLYPNIAYFVDAIGWIELGHNYDSPLTSLIRALDQGGMVWEGKDRYTTLDEAFQDLEHGLAAWFQDAGIRAAN